MRGNLFCLPRSVVFLALFACKSGSAPTGEPVAPAAQGQPQPTGEQALAKPAADVKASADAASKQADQPADAKPAGADPSAPEDVAAVPANAHKTASGLASRVLKPGTGSEHPTADDSVQVHYSGWTTDGKLFDSSVSRGVPAKFPLGRVIKGWTEGVQLMVVGEKRRFWLPAELAYGASAPPGTPAGMLVFDIELLDFTSGAKPVPAPSDVAKVPHGAKHTASGLAYRVLKKGRATRHPKPTDTVEVHYTGWTTDGKMFDSSVQRGEPATFPLNGVIPGWTEGLQLMTEGQQVRFWVPVQLAYNNQPGRPHGMLVFDVELLSIR